MRLLCCFCFLFSFLLIHSVQVHVELFKGVKKFKLWRFNNERITFTAQYGHQNVITKLNPGGHEDVCAIVPSEEEILEISDIDDNNGLIFTTQKKAKRKTLYGVYMNQLGEFPYFENEAIKWKIMQSGNKSFVAMQSEIDSKDYPNFIIVQYPGRLKSLRCNIDVDDHRVKTSSNGDYTIYKNPTPSQEETEFNILGGEKNRKITLSTSIYDVKPVDISNIGHRVIFSDRKDGKLWIAYQLDGKEDEFVPVYTYNMTWGYKPYETFVQRYNGDHRFGMIKDSEGRVFAYLDEGHQIIYVESPYNIRDVTIDSYTPFIGEDEIQPHHILKKDGKIWVQTRVEKYDAKTYFKDVLPKSSQQIKDLSEISEMKDLTIDPETGKLAVLFYCRGLRVHGILTLDFNY